MSIALLIFIWALPLFSGGMEAATRAIITTTKEIHNFTVLGVGFLSALPLYILWLIFVGMPEIETGFWLVILLHVPLFIIAMLLTVEAHKISPLSTTMPYMALTPAFILCFTPLIALFFPIVSATPPSILGIIGILIMVLGLYILNLQVKNISVFQPLSIFWNDKGARLMFLAAILFSFTAILDFVALSKSNSPLYLLVDHGILGISMLVLIAVYTTFNIKHTKTFRPTKSMPLFLFGILTGIGTMAHMYALEFIPVVSYVIAGKRAGAIIFALCFGLVLSYIIKHPHFQDEKHNLRYRIPGTLITIAGMIIVIFWGNV